MQPKVTIALPVYNGATTLATAIRSILQQSFQNWELIILDDLSTDHSLEVIRAFDDPRILLISGRQNIGLSARLNMAANMARGTYFARADQDDASFPNRISLQVIYLEKHPDIDLLATAIIPFRGKCVPQGILPVAGEHSQICARPWNGFHLPHPTWMGKTTWFRQHRYESFSDGVEDQYLLLRTYRVSRFACLKEPLLAYREDNRVLKKMLRARRIFARTYIHQFITEWRFDLAIKVAISFLLKCAADTLNLLFGFSRMRNTLLPLSESDQAAWQVLWDRLEREENIIPHDKGCRQSCTHKFNSSQ
jgi:glycosyltransferase involved in cell wall biosynthesis